MIDLRICKKENQQVIAGLCQFYYYDLDSKSKLANLHYQNGRYDKMAYFDNYWQEENRFPYLIYKNETPIGFALVHDISVNPDADWKLAEFFVMTPYKHQGIGASVAQQLFEKHQGLWEVSVLRDNLPALGFWNKVLAGTKQVTHPDFQNYIFFEVLKD